MPFVLYIYMYESQYFILGFYDYLYRNQPPQQFRKNKPHQGIT